MTHQKPTLLSIVKVANPTQMSLFGDAEHHNSLMLPLAEAKQNIRIAEGFESLSKQALADLMSDLDDSLAPHISSGISVNDGRAEAVVAATGLEPFALELATFGAPSLSEEVFRRLKSAVSASQCVAQMKSQGVRKVALEIDPELGPLQSEVGPDGKTLKIGSKRVAKALEALNRFASSRSQSYLIDGADFEVPARSVRAFTSKLLDEAVTLVGHIESHDKVAGELKFKIWKKSFDYATPSIKVELPKKSKALLKFFPELCAATIEQYRTEPEHKIILKVRPFEVAGSAYGMIVDVQPYEDLVESRQLSES